MTNYNFVTYLDTSKDINIPSMLLKSNYINWDDTTPERKNILFDLMKYDRLNSPYNYPLSNTIDQETSNNSDEKIEEIPKEQTLTPSLLKSLKGVWLVGDSYMSRMSPLFKLAGGNVIVATGKLIKTQGENYTGDTDTTRSASGIKYSAASIVKVGKNGGKYALVHTGANDIAYGNPDKWRKDLTQLAENANKYGIKIYFINLNYVGVLNHDKTDAFNQVAAEIAQQYNWKLIDVSGYNLKTLSDKLHLANDKEYFDIIKSLMLVSKNFYGGKLIKRYKY